MTAKTHGSQEDIIKRLKRAAGHLNGIISMLKELACAEIAQQLQAVESALGSAKKHSYTAISTIALLMPPGKVPKAWTPLSVKLKSFLNICRRRNSRFTL